MQTVEVSHDWPVAAKILQKSAHWQHEVQDIERILLSLLLLLLLVPFLWIVLASSCSHEIGYHFALV